MKKTVLLVLTMILPSGCGWSVGENDYPGLYILKEVHTREEIEVVADGTYKHRFESDKESISEHGYWDKDQFGGEKGITFRSFQVKSRQIRKPRGYWFVVPQRSWSREILLCFDLERFELEGNGCFSKVE